MAIPLPTPWMRASFRASRSRYFSSFSARSLSVRKTLVERYPPKKAMIKKVGIFSTRFITKGSADDITLSKVQ